MTEVGGLTFDPFDAFAEADAARALCAPARSDNDDDDVGSDAEDEHGRNVLAERLRAATARFAWLKDGSVHVCGADCPYAEENREGDCVCRFTGLVVVRVCAARTDASDTGRSTWSADPDMNGGAIKWQKKRDQVHASHLAYDYAATLDDTAMPHRKVPDAPRAAPAKRGALCVDAAPPLDVAPKRQRTSKKDVGSREQQRLLWTEAEATLLELLGKCGSKSIAPAGAIDERLLDHTLLYEASVKKYLKETLASGGIAQVDDLNNIWLAVGRVIEEEKRKRADSGAARGYSGRVFQPGFRESAAALAVQLWRGACGTPYLTSAKRGADSFKPFCAGVFYAFKRGLTLGDGTVLVPRIGAFADSLPSSREINANTSSKTLHASSHKGLKTLHQCIGSVDVAQARELWADAIRSAQQIRG